MPQCLSHLPLIAYSLDYRTTARRQKPSVFSNAR
jgi:hypothetical protein